MTATGSDEHLCCRNEEPTRAQANLVLIERRPASWYNIFGLHRLYDYITPDLWTFPRGVRPSACMLAMLVSALPRQADRRVNEIL